MTIFAPISRRAVVVSLAACAFAPMARAATGSPRNFILYFKTNSTVLSQAATKVAADAAAAIKTGLERQQLSHIKVIGYSDTTGSMATAQHLSEERALTVRNELIRLGVAEALIKTEGRGKKNLAVPTADQVNQPRNRRVRIILYRPGD